MKIGWSWKEEIIETQIIVKAELDRAKSGLDLSFQGLKTDFRDAKKELGFFPGEVIGTIIARKLNQRTIKER